MHLDTWSALLSGIVTIAQTLMMGLTILSKIQFMTTAASIKACRDTEWAIWRTRFDRPPVSGEAECWQPSRPPLMKTEMMTIIDRAEVLPPLPALLLLLLRLLLSINEVSIQSSDSQRNKRQQAATAAAALVSRQYESLTMDTSTTMASRPQPVQSHLGLIMPIHRSQGKCMIR
jgi:hypothetical protein